MTLFDPRQTSNIDVAVTQDWQSDRTLVSQELIQTSLSTLEDIRDSAFGSSLADRLRLISPGNRMSHARTSVDLMAGRLSLALPLIWGSVWLRGKSDSGVPALLEVTRELDLLTLLSPGQIALGFTHRDHFGLECEWHQIGQCLELLRTCSMLVISTHWRRALRATSLGMRLNTLRLLTDAPVFVSIAPCHHIAELSCQIAHSGADGIIIDAERTATNGMPAILGSRVGMPIEIAISTVDQALHARERGGRSLREQICLVSAGNCWNAVDILHHIALGADAVLMRHAPIAIMDSTETERSELTAGEGGITIHEKLVSRLLSFVQGIKLELQHLLGDMGMPSPDMLTGHREFLRLTHGQQDLSNALGVTVTGQDTQHVSPLNMTEALWTRARRRHIQHMAETGEPSMGTLDFPVQPMHETSQVPCDSLWTDHRQFSDLSLDPTRDIIETTVYLTDERVHLSQPVFLSCPSRSMLGNSVELAVCARVVNVLGLAQFLWSDGSLADLQRYRARMIPRLPAEVTSQQLNEVAGLALVLDYREEALARNVDRIKGETGGKPVFIRLPSGPNLEQDVLNIALTSADGILLDTMSESFISAEVAISLTDCVLRENRMTDTCFREKLSVLLLSNRVRGADDIYRFMALGADAVSLAQAAHFAIFPQENLSLDELEDVARIRLENYLHSIQRELKLLMAITGISRTSSLVGNRDLLRAIDMDSSLREQLGVKPISI